MLDRRLLMASSQIGVADAASPDLADRVAQALQPYFAQDQFPGISVAIVKNGQVALAQGYGTSDVATGSPVEANTRFDIGSVTKTFTALGVLLLYQDAARARPTRSNSTPRSVNICTRPSLSSCRASGPISQRGNCST